MGIKIILILVFLSLFIYCLYRIANELKTNNIEIDMQFKESGEFFVEFSEIGTSLKIIYIDYYPNESKIERKIIYNGKELLKETFDRQEALKDKMGFIPYTVDNFEEIFHNVKKKIKRGGYNEKSR